MSQETEIKNCPWCGSTKIMCEGYLCGDFVVRCAMVCQKCLARGPEISVNNKNRNKKQPALKVWNKRYDDPPERNT